MSGSKTPRSLRSRVQFELSVGKREAESAGVVTVACLIAAASATAAEAQQASSPLPAVTVDAPVASQRPAAAKPSPAQVKARAAMRKRARELHPAQAAPAPGTPSVAGLPILARAPDGDPYANPAAPYMAQRLASQKFSEPIVNTPKSVTVLTSEILEDKNATSLREVARSTAGLTLGTGEGGNAFGDRFFIRGFDARNDVFVDGVRDPAVSIRENFFTEQIEILKGPSSSFAGRGTAGGALNIVTKQAADQDFYKSEGTLGTDRTKRVTFDVNKVVSPGLDVRLNGMFQNADVAGRDYTFDNRWGLAGAATFKPTDTLKFTADYYHVDMHSLPDFGVPYDVAAQAPFTSAGVPRGTFYGFVNRDFQNAIQDVGTLTGEAKVNDNVTLSNKFRLERSVLDYIGTIPESPNISSPNPALWTVTDNPQSRYQTTNVIDDQTDATIKFNTGPVANTAIVGTEFSNERVSMDKYNGLSSEAIGPGAFNGSGSVVIPLFNPPNTIPFSQTPTLTGNPTIIPVDTKSVYVIETANYKDLVILNGGVRYDDYHVSASNAQGSVSDHSGMVNYNLGVVVKPLPIASVYAAYATSSDPVGAELDGTSTNYGGLNPSATVNQVFGPTQTKAAEVGTKWEFIDKRLLATAALFQTDVDNAREVVPTGLPNAGNVVAGAAYRVQGVDFGLTGKLTDRWSVFGGLVLMNTKVTKSVVPTNIGLPLAFIANQSFNLLTKYQLTDRYEIGGQAVYDSKIYGGTLLAANQGTVLPAHWRFDAFFEAKVTENFKLKLAVTNIFNTLYYDAFYQSAAPFVMVAPGRTVSLVAQAKF